MFYFDCGNYFAAHMRNLQYMRACCYKRYNNLFFIISSFFIGNEEKNETIV